MLYGSDMKSSMFSIIFALMIGVTLSGFSRQESGFGQPREERLAQEALPQSKDEIWKKLGQCKVQLDKKKYRYSISYSKEVKAMNGKSLTVSGFMLPLEATEKFSHFLLSKRTPTCPYCPPGQPNEIIEIYTSKPVTWDDSLITVSGTLKLITSNPELGLFFQMKDASLKQAASKH